VLNLEDGTDQELDNKLGNSMSPQRLLSQNIKEATHLIFQTMEETTHSLLLLPTQDGGKCSD
jgi:hypothetical protein